MPKTLIVTLAALIFLAFTNYQQPALHRAAAPPPAMKSSLAKSVNSKTAISRVMFEDGLKALYQRIGGPNAKLNFNAFRLGMIGYYMLGEEGALNEKELLTIIDFSRPSTEKRFFTIDLKNSRIKYHTYVAHGRNTGENMATDFSNIPHSNQSSLGFYVTGETYIGSKGYSLRLDGVEDKYNGNIRSRAVVVHGAKYVSESWINRYGRLGRSQGCPALPQELSAEVIDAIKGKTAIFSYYPEEDYLTHSRYLKLNKLLDQMNDKVTVSDSLQVVI